MNKRHSIKEIKSIRVTTCPSGFLYTVLHHKQSESTMSADWWEIEKMYSVAAQKLVMATRPSI
jgi:hypothetical protein